MTLSFKKHKGQVNQGRHPTPQPHSKKQQGHDGRERERKVRQLGILTSSSGLMIFSSKVS